MGYKHSVQLTYCFMFIFCDNICLLQTVSAERIIFVTSYFRDKENVGPPEP